MKQRSEIAFDPRHDRLAFRVAETNIIFNQLGPLRGQHQSRIKHAAKRCSRLRHRPCIVRRAKHLGDVQAPDAKTAEAAAVAEFKLDDEQRKRLVVQERDEP